MYDESTLDNGIRVVTKRMEGRESSGLAFWVRVGSRFEKKAHAGASHFLEHMLFKGTKNRSTKEIKQDIEGVGGLFNAFTGEESTCYFVKIPKEHFTRAFDVLQDMVNYSTLETKEFTKEKSVILEEIKMYLDLPAQYVHELVTELLWPQQALGRPIAGTVETVSRLSRNDLAAHFRAYYHPRNLLITACGEFDHEEVTGLTHQYFKDGKNEKTASRFNSVDEVRAKNHFHFLEKKTEQTHFVIGFPGLSRRDPARYQLALLNVILGANMSSRLFEEVREKRGLAYEIKSGLSFFEDTGAVTVSAGVEPEKAHRAASVIVGEFERLKQKPAPEAELRRAKDYFLGQLLLGLEDTLDHILWFGERVLYGGEIPSVGQIRAEIEKVTSQEIKELAKKIFIAKKLRLALIGPLAAGTESKMKKACVFA